MKYLTRSIIFSEMIILKIAFILTVSIDLDLCLRNLLWLDLPKIYIISLKRNLMAKIIS